MRKQVRDLLNHCNLGEKYKEGAIGEADKYEVKFPFVCKNTKQSVIKPIHFKQDKPSQLIDHGLSWLAKVQQLEKYRFIRPDEILFAYDAPDDSQSNLFDAFNDIKEQIEKEGIVMADINCNEDIVKFATSPQN
ncbi:hypothetical protein [Methylobacter sp.]|uniref:hypothetical protein n=1 Tax=Methylobacter sp. TaxID=2051955 RepID=UPI001224BC0F|nr:hypothetical protein [Methylobacter sp.]TAK64638.1 MAG: hypothetical protein EPO18_02560 [Methylobacter sp.]